MSEAISSKISTECVLSASDCFIETLSIKTIEALPWMVELVIRTQLLNAKNPAEKRVKSRTCIDRTRLIELQNVIGQSLATAPGATGHPSKGYAAR